MKNILVVGGGIGGLCVTLMLQKNGFHVRLFEAAPVIKAVGAGLGVGSNALQALYETGVGTQIEEHGNPLHEMIFLNDRGEMLNKMDFTPLEREFGLHSLTIHRADLHRILKNAIEPGTIQLNKRCKDFKESSNGVTLFFEDGTNEKGDIVIAADGIHSMFRKRLVPYSEPRYAGYACWRGVVHARDPEIKKHTSYEIWGSDGRFGIVPLKDDFIYWFGCVNAPSNDPKLRTYTPEDVAQVFHAFPNYVRKLITLTKKEELLFHDILDIRPLQKFAFGRIVLLGDAAHATTPNMGQGAGQSMEDAIVLTKSLRDTGGTEEAFKLYEKKRISRTKKIINLSRQIGAAAQWENKGAIAVRNRLFQLFPSKLLLRRFRFILDVDL